MHLNCNSYVPVCGCNIPWDWEDISSSYACLVPPILIPCWLACSPVPVNTEIKIVFNSSSFVLVIYINWFNPLCYRYPGHNVLPVWGWSIPWDCGVISSALISDACLILPMFIPCNEAFSPVPKRKKKD